MVVGQPLILGLLKGRMSGVEIGSGFYRMMGKAIVEASAMGEVMDHLMISGEATRR